MCWGETLRVLWVAMAAVTGGVLLAALSAGCGAGSDAAAADLTGSALAETLPRNRPAVLFRTGEWADCSAVLKEDVKGKTDQWIDHSSGYLVPKDLYYDKHPEYYSMLADGKRIAKDAFSYHRTPLCLSNPDVTRISIERALRWVAKQPQKKYFPITYGDIGAWCQCPACRKLDPAPGQYATRLLTWVNAVAREVGKKYPDKIITTFAYGGTDAAPPKVRPEKNVWVIAAVGFAGLPFWHHDLAAGRAKGSVDKIDAWLKIAPDQVAVCEYEGQYYPAMVDTIAGKARFYARKGIRYVFFTYGRPANFVWLWRELYPKLLFDPTQDAHAIAREAIRAHYGPAAEPMQAYFDLCHRRYQETRKTPLEEGGGYPVGFYSPQFTDEAIACFERAVQAAAGQGRLAGEIAAEQTKFVMDWMQHPVSDEMTAAARQMLRKQCSLIAKLAGDSPDSPAAKRIALANRIHKLAVAAEAKQKGALAVTEQWLTEQKFPMPQAFEKLRGGGVRIGASGFMWAGYSGKYGGAALHPVPAKQAVAIYVKGNSARRSHRTEAVFELDDVPGDGSATLSIEGQDSDHEVDPAEIRIDINGKSVFEGPVTVVKWMWSRQDFKIPPGVLKKGPNKIEFFNVVDPKTIKNWFERWFMLTEAVIRFEK